MLPMPQSSASGSNDPMKDMIQLWETKFPPFKLWMQAAATYQRQLTNTISDSTKRTSSSRENVATHAMRVGRSQAVYPRL